MEETDSEEETIVVEFSASQLQALQILLNYNSVSFSLENPQYAAVANELSGHIMESIATDNFVDQIEKEAEEAQEEIDELFGMGVSEHSLGRGVQ